MSKYGLDGDLSALTLPKQKQTRPKPEPETLARAKAEAKNQGFEDRSPQPEGARKAHKPGRKSTEPQDMLTIRGPERVLDRFRDYCQSHPSYWQAIEELLEK